MREDISFCKRIALGGLLQGYFHNIRGTLQGIFLELQLILMKAQKDSDVNQEIQDRINKTISLLQKLQNQIDTALDDIYNENKGPWDLRDIIEKEILFWEAFMPFKHKVKKEIIEEEKCFVEVPYNLLMALFCNFCKEIFLNLKEGTELKIFIKNKKVDFTWDKDLDFTIYENLKKLSQVFRELVDVEIDKRVLSFHF